jgi:hypothetical protein
MGMPAAETELLSQQQQQQQQQQHQVGRDPQNRNAIFAKSDLLAQETEKPASRMFAFKVKEVWRRQRRSV